MVTFQTSQSSNMSSPATAPRKSNEELEKVFKAHHVLKVSNRQNIEPSTPKQNESFTSDVSSIGAENLSRLDAFEVENDPKTPRYREEHKQARSIKQFSPALLNFTGSSESSTNNSPSILNNASKPNLHRNSLMNRIKATASRVSSSNSTPDTKSSDSSSPPALIQSPSKAVEKAAPTVPASILKKSVTVLDIETSRQLVEKHPELRSSLDSNKQLKATKAARVLVSPKKKDIIHHYTPLPSSSPSMKPIRNSSPLTDSINGNRKSNFKSPYLRDTKRRSNLNKQQKDEEEWIDDQQSDDDDDEDAADGRNRKKSKKKSKARNWLTLLFSFKFKSLIDPQLPYILSLYLQLIFNVLIVSILLYFVYSFISTVKADVENKVDSYAADIIQEIALCSREYLRNNCQPGKRVIALEAACSQWEKCMNQDPTTVGRAKIGAETFAEIINGFIKPISWKSMTFLFLITVGSLVLTNAAFGTYRNYTQYDTPYQNHPQHSQHHQPPPAQTSIHQTPFQTPYRTLQYDPGYTRFYTPKASASPTSAAIVRHRSKNPKKSRR